MRADAEVEVHGPSRAHQVRFDLEIDLVQGAAIVKGWVQRSRQSGDIMEKPIPKAVFDRMREDRDLLKWLFDNTVASFPNG